MRLRASVVLAAAVACSVAVAGAATTAPGSADGVVAKGLPKYTKGYAKWPKINRKPIRKSSGLSAAHQGVKNVYRNKKKRGKKWPNGTIIIKSIDQPGGSKLPEQVAVMRKLRGTWRWIEWEWRGSRYRVLARGATCTGCHMQAKSNDWVFTRR